MKLLIEDYGYDMADVADVLDGLFTLQDVEQKVKVGYVGYYYNPHDKVRDMVFILPKVLINEEGLVFGEYEPKDLINLEDAKISEEARKFIYEFAVWIHRAIVVFNDSHPKNEIVLHRNIEDMGKGSHKKKSNTLLDVILSLIRFNKENQHFFTFTLKNLHSGHNKINWGKTITRTTAIVQDGNPTYLNPVNKKRMVNFDEELIIIFFSILHYVADTYGFKSNINFGFELMTGSKFKRYLNGFGKRRLRQIKYKYFSDTAVRLWDLCYAFFEKYYQIRMDAAQSEYLLVKSFHIVFEAMIDELVGTPSGQLPKGLKEQYDGKVLDHLYTYQGLLSSDQPDDEIYYIGDSKYYKLDSEVGKESIYKQRTYARNVIQWNLDLWGKGENDMENQFEKIKIRDEVTEGYNIIPNFFISARLVEKDGKQTFSFEDTTGKHPVKQEASWQFENRLFDRDTLLLSHYNVNFLYVLSLYAKNKAAEKNAWREKIRRTFREAVMELLKSKYYFYALAAHPDVNAQRYFQSHFQETLGKTFRPYENQQVFSLALDRSPEYEEENERLKARLAENFYVVPVELGENPSDIIDKERIDKGVVESPEGMGKFLFANIRKSKPDKDGRKSITKDYIAFSKHEAKYFSMRITEHFNGDFTNARFFVPMFNRGIDGYYSIEGISFGSRNTEVTDKNGTTVDIPMPYINIKLGEYIPLGDYIVEVPNFRNWNGQLHTYAKIMDLYKK